MADLFRDENVLDTRNEKAFPILMVQRREAPKLKIENAFVERRVSQAGQNVSTQYSLQEQESQTIRQSNPAADRYHTQHRAAFIAANYFTKTFFSFAKRGRPFSQA